MLFTRSLIVGLCAFASSSWGQADSSAPAQPSPLKTWGVPLLEVAGFNGAIAAHNKWIAQAHYGQITFASMRRNLRTGMVWDADNFIVNQIGHPYQGGLYYSSAREFGHNYLVGAGYAALGSLQWEYFMETESPAINDFITTTLGGAMLGEMTYRLSEEILDDRTRGMERFFRELLAGLVNPTHGLNRLLDGAAFKSSTKPRTYHRLLYRISTGGVLRSSTRGTSSLTQGVQSVPKANTEYLVWYGDEFTAKKPFDFFIINMGINMVRDPVSSVYARALLGSYHLFGSENDYGILTLGQNFDFINSGIYKIGASGLGGGYSHRLRWGQKWYHLLQVMAGGIAVGGASTEFFRDGERDYNLGPGAFSTSRVVVGRYDFGHIAMNIDRYWIYTLSGATGHELIGIGMIEASKSIYGAFGGILSYTFYDRTAQYENHPSQSRLNQEFRLALHMGFH